MFLYLPGGNEEQACKEEKTEIYANIIKSFFAMAQMKMKTANFFFCLCFSDFLFDNCVEKVRLYKTNVTLTLDISVVFFFQDLNSLKLILNYVLNERK